MFSPNVISDGHKITINTSAGVRLALFPVFLIVLPFLVFFLSLPLIFLKVYGFQIATLQAWLIGWAAAALTAVLEWPLWIAINPWQLQLDLDQRSYKLMQGWGPWARTRMGTTQDIRGLYLRIRKNQPNTRFKAVLAWKMRRLSFVLRITYSDQVEAEEWLQNLANQLNVPYLGVNPVLKKEPSSSRVAPDQRPLEEEPLDRKAQ